MSSGKTRKKSFSSLVPPTIPASQLRPESPSRSPAVMTRSNSSVILPDFFSVERPQSIEEEQQRQIHLLHSVIQTWKTRWKQENDDKIKQLRKKDHQVLSQRSQLQKLAVSRDRIIKEKHSLEKQFKKTVKQHSIEKAELQNQIKDLKEECETTKQVITAQNKTIVDLKAKLQELTELNNNECLNPRCEKLKEQNESLRSEARILNLKVKEGELRDENYNVLIQTSLDRIRTLESQANTKPRRGCLGERYVLHADHMHPSDVSLSPSVPSGLETRSLGSLDSLESMLEDVCIKAAEAEEQNIAPVVERPLHISRSTDVLQPMLHSSPDLDVAPSPQKYPLQRKGSLDFERLSPQRRKRLSGFEFLKPKQNNTQAPREGKRKRRTADFADLLRKIANGGTNTSGLENEKRHSQKGSKPKRGSLKH